MNGKTMRLRLLGMSLLLLTGLSCAKENFFSSYVDSPGNTTYYIDSESGNNASTGTSESAAWKNFEKVNLTTFQAGDRILLKRGGIWNGSLFPSGSGSQEQPIVIGAYGTGDAPLINANGVDSAAVHLKNQSHWIIQDLEITNKADARDQQYRWGILVENRNRTLLSNIQILNNVVHDVTGSFHYVATKSPHMNGGIAVVVFGTGATDRFDGVHIEGNLVYNVGRTGIVVWDQHWSGTGQASTNVVMRQNTVRDIDGDGVLAFGCNGAVLEHNLADRCGSYVESGENAFNGSVAIWATRGADCVVQYNEAMNTKKLPGNLDGQGFDVDIDAINHIVQYNYSHDNEGGFILIMSAAEDPGSLVGTSGATVRYNISQNDMFAIISFAGGIAPNTRIYNNTFYIKEGLETNIIDYSWPMNMAPAYSFQNNIVYNLGTGGYNIPGPNGTFATNLYYGNHPSSEPYEQNKLTADPLLVAAGSGTEGRGSLNGYTLAANSPALGAGTFIAQHGGLDFFGNEIPEMAKPSVGAYFVYKGDAEPPIQEDFVDHLNDGSKLLSRSENTLFDNSNPHFFEGDNGRLTRTDGNKATLVYQTSPIKSFEIKAYLFDADVTKIKVYASANGSTWTPVTSTYATPVPTEGGWTSATVIPSADLPANTTYLKIELEDPNSWGTQIGRVELMFHNSGGAGNVMVDDLNDPSKLFEYSGNMSLDTSNPQLFEEDNSRATRSDGNTGRLVYQGSQLKSLTLKAFLFDADVTKIKVYVSADGQSWTPAPTAFTPLAETGNGWKSTSIASTADFPAGTNYVKIELEDPSSWGTQIGQVSIWYE